VKGFLWCPHCRLPHSLEATACPQTGKPLEGVARPKTRGVVVGTILAQRYRVGAWAGAESIAHLHMGRQIVTRRRVMLSGAARVGRASSTARAPT
jgi:hypothetical protein